MIALTRSVEALLRAALTQLAEAMAAGEVWELQHPDRTVQVWRNTDGTWQIWTSGRGRSQSQRVAAPLEAA